MNKFDPGTCVIKRPEHNALDADGVETKTNDTVWIISSGVKGTVSFIHGKRVHINFDDGGDADIPLSNITHREPDSLEKMRDDLKRKYGSNSAWVKRLTAIMERDA